MVTTQNFRLLDSKTQVKKKPQFNRLIFMFVEEYIA